MIIAANYFCQTPHRRCFTWFWINQGSGHTSGFEYAMVLNMSQVLNMPGFWIYQESEYAYCSDYAKFLNRSSEYARITLGSGYAWTYLNNSWICLIMSEYIWICRNMCEYAHLMVFCFIFPHFNFSSTWRRG